MIYFSYGSNMSIFRLSSRIPATRIGVAMLREHQLRFHKVSNKDGSAKCDAFQTDHVDDVVIGVVYQINAIDKPVLDVYEGTGNGYDVKTVHVEMDDVQVEAFTYYATELDAGLKPFCWYKQHVLTGAKENDLPDHYIDMIRAVESVNDSNLGRLRKELSIYDAVNLGIK